MNGIALTFVFSGIDVPTTQDTKRGIFLVKSKFLAHPREYDNNDTHFPFSRFKVLAHVVIMIVKSTCSECWW